MNVMNVLKKINEWRGFIWLVSAIIVIVASCVRHSNNVENERIDFARGLNESGEIEYYSFTTGRTVLIFDQIDENGFPTVLIFRPEIACAACPANDQGVNVNFKTTGNEIVKIPGEYWAATAAIKVDVNELLFSNFASGRIVTFYPIEISRPELSVSIDGQFKKLIIDQFGQIESASPIQLNTMNF